MTREESTSSSSNPLIGFAKKFTNGSKNKQEMNDLKKQQTTGWVC